MKIEKFDNEKSRSSFHSLGDNEKNLEWANNFIKNFNQVYEKEDQSFFIKQCCGQHNRIYIAFILHPLNTFPMGNSVAIVNVDQYFRNFKEEFRRAFRTVSDINRQYLVRKEEWEANRPMHENVPRKSKRFNF